MTKIESLELAQIVVDQMDYNEMKESAIVGLTTLYEEDREKFIEDLENEGL